MVHVKVGARREYDDLVGSVAEVAAVVRGRVDGGKEGLFHVGIEL